MTTQHACVPRWGTRPPQVDGSGRTFGIVAPPGCPVAREWAAQLDILGRPYWHVPPHGVEAALGGATVGLRVLVSGPEVEVLAVAARLRSAGLADAELTTHATSTGHRRVYCAHCKQTSLFDAAVDDVVTCPSCRRGLLVFAHASARSGSYLGFQADAEEEV